MVIRKQPPSTEFLRDVEELDDQSVYLLSSFSVRVSAGHYRFSAWSPRDAQLGSQEGRAANACVKSKGQLGSFSVGLGNPTSGPAC